nr:hypothetical protein HmN_000300800 [Hymenolepis microstoma]
MTNNSIISADNKCNSPEKTSPLLAKSEVKHLHELLHRINHPEKYENLHTEEYSHLSISQVDNSLAGGGCMEEGTNPDIRQSAHDFCMNNNYHYFHNQSSNFGHHYVDDLNERQPHRHKYGRVEASKFPWRMRRNVVQWQNNSLEALYRSKKRIEEDDRLNASEITYLPLQQTNAWTQCQENKCQGPNPTHSHTHIFNTGGQIYSSGCDYFSNKGIDFENQEIQYSKLSLDGHGYQESHWSFQQPKDEQTNTFNNNSMQFQNPYNYKPIPEYDQMLMAIPAVPSCLWHFGRKGMMSGGQERNTSSHCALLNQDSVTSHQRNSCIIHQGEVSKGLDGATTLELIQSSLTILDDERHFAGLIRGIALLFLTDSYWNCPEQIALGSTTTGAVINSLRHVFENQDLSQVTVTSSLHLDMRTFVVISMFSNLARFHTAMIRMSNMLGVRTVTSREAGEKDSEEILNFVRIRYWVSSQFGGPTRVKHQKHLHRQ